MNWIVSELFYPDEVSTAQIMTDIALQKVIDNQVSVICGPSGYENSYTSQKKLDARIKVYRIRLSKLNKNKLFQRVLRLLLLTLKMSWAILVKVKKNDSVFLTTNPTFLIITIALLKKIKGFKLEILVHDVFPENLVPAGLIKKDSLKYEFLSKIYNFSYQKADRIIVLGEDMRLLMVEKVAPQTKKIDIITNWSDNDIYSLDDFNISEYLRIDLKDKIVFGFAGNLGRVQGILEFIDLFECSGNSNIALVIIGDGALRSTIQEKIKNIHLQNVYYLGPKPRSEQNFFLNACHIGVVTLINGMKGLGVPSKTYNLMAAGKPLFYIGDKGSEVDSYVKNYDCGWSFDWENKNEILSYLKNINSENWIDVLEKGCKSRIAAENFKKDKVLTLF
jgi:glycosyltransferase involved in cell wall biosynthesis